MCFLHILFVHIFWRTVLLDSATRTISESAVLVTGFVRLSLYLFYCNFRDRPFPSLLIFGLSPASYFFLFYFCSSLSSFSLFFFLLLNFSTGYFFFWLYQSFLYLIVPTYFCFSLTSHTFIFFILFQ